MKNRRKFSIFISSTYEDLKKERQALVGVALENNFIPVGMEQFHAKDTLVATVTTDETGSAVVENLPLGKYRVEEKKNAGGLHLECQRRRSNFYLCRTGYPSRRRRSDFYQ